MKKNIFLAMLIILLGLSVQLFFVLSYQMNGKKQNSYARFLKMNSDGKEVFNWSGLISPIQSEGQEVKYDTVNFTKRVIYPLAPKFTVIPPDDSTAEMRVANEIAQTISDSLNKSKFDLVLDYDNQMLAVRESAKPRTRKLADPLIQISLFGTASPEAHKYGLRESLLPGNFEPENSQLANRRLRRTGKLLQYKLLEMGINPEWTEYGSDELQLKDTNQVTEALLNSSILDSMRYVSANVTITTESLEITPITTPIALPIWLVGLTWLLTYLLKKRKGDDQSESYPPADKKWSWGWLEILGQIIFGIAFLLFLIGFFNLIPWISLMKLFGILVWIITGILILIGLCVVLYAVALLLTTTKADWSNFFRAIWKGILQFLSIIMVFLFWILEGIIMVLIFVINWIIDQWTTLCIWWQARCTCCKVLIVILLAHLIFDLFYFII